MYRYCCCHYGGRISNDFLYVEKNAFKKDVTNNYVEKNACKKDVTNNYVTPIIDFVFLNYST